MQIPTVVLNGITKSPAILQDIEGLKYNIILTSPEMLEQPDVRKITSNTRFAKRVGAFIVDEAHCIKQWAKDSKFREHYGRVGTLRSIAPQNTPVLATSATMTCSALSDVREELAIHPTRSFHLNLGNDRSNIKQELRFIKSASDYDALSFIVEGAQHATDLPRTIVFVNELSKCHAAAHRLRQRVAEPLQSAIGHFHAKRAQSAKEEALEGFRDGRIRVLIATEAAGMGMDIPDIELIVQFGVPENLCVWLQRAGRAGRSPRLQARAVMLAEAAVIQEVVVKKESGEMIEGTDSDFYEEEEQDETQQQVKPSKKSYKKNIEDAALREWIETEGCRRAVADAYFDNPPRAHAQLIHPLTAVTTVLESKLQQSPRIINRTLRTGHLHGPGTKDLQSLGMTMPTSMPSPVHRLPNPNRGWQEPVDSSIPLSRACQSPKRRKDEHLKHIKTELRAWRVKIRRLKYAGTSLKADNILPDRTLQTIASQQRGIKTIDDLRPLLKPPWPFLELHGDEVLQLVKKLDEEDEQQRHARNLQAREERRREKEQ
ncbi:hypothetical protein BN946_scf184817.g7 [Trametes cinnabarina]|uniref:DNA 3'-5' helicase n=1 Tax=Pycnoporus cinnabarinus TaxID=5643 RepID=A0A060S4R9_PYCCI|nr:hypothetical protein BN946_scf184817.g7 [Trametes cinnabarina]